MLVVDAAGESETRQIGIDEQTEGWIEMMVNG